MLEQSFAKIEQAFSRKRNDRFDHAGRCSIV